MAKSDIADLNELLSEARVDKIGIARLEDWRDTPLYEKAKKLLPGAKSIIVMAMELFPETVNYVSSQATVGDMTLRDLYNANYEVAGGHLDWEGYKLIKALHKQGFKGLLLPAGGSPSDGRFLVGPISYKNAAEAAGLGIIGWHGLLITPEFGSRVRLASIITDAPLEGSPPLKMESPCLKCGGACIKICPARAIARPEAGDDYHLDKFACSTYYTASGMCSECLRVCPAGRVSRSSATGG